MADGIEKRETTGRRLGDWAAKLTWEAVPPPVQRVAQRAVIDTVGVAVAATGKPPVLRVLEAALLSGGWGNRDDAQVPVALPFGIAPVRRWLPTTGAARVTATAAHALDFDDTCFAGVAHGSAVILPAALAMAQARRRRGTDLLTAFVAGSEVAYGIGAAFGSRLYDAGWFPTPMLGAPGAAVAAAWLLDLDGAGIARALGLALTRSPALRVVAGTDAKPVLVGLAAEAGIQAALLSSLGATAPKDALEAANGLLQQVGGPEMPDDPAGRAARIDVGTTWRLQQPGLSIKRWPLCSSAQGVIEAILAALQALDLAPGDAAARQIEAIDCTVMPMVAVALPFERPTAPAEAMFSLPFAAAAAVMAGGVGVGGPTAAAVSNPVPLELMRRVRVRVDPGLADPATCPEAVRVRVALTTQREATHDCCIATGDPRRPLSDAALRQKFLDCAGPALGGDGAAALLARLSDLPLLDDCRALEAVPG